jgi:transcriptional regulator with XRE-family HTH domain
MTNKPDPIDIEVGRRIRVRRAFLDKTQSDLGVALGVTFQQVQKYENGTNRLSASRLQTIAKFLGVAVTYFFGPLSNVEGAPIETELMSIDGAPELLRAYGAISDKVVRRRLVAFLESLGAEPLHGRGQASGGPA